MPTLKNISVISIPVSDPDRAKRFYSETLGLEVLRDNEFAPGQRWIQLSPAGAETTISLVTWFEDLPPGTIRGNLFEVDDLEAAKSELSSRGLEFTGDDMNTPWGSFAPFEDPDGNRWSLHCPSNS